MKFDTSQKHSLEGNFDKHFTTYFPKFYSIDALSIISPEVMQTLITADEFDIEIHRDTLYLFGALQSPERVKTMITAGKNIRHSLLNNIHTYRDEHLAVADGRKSVSTYGIELRSNPWIELPLALLGVGILVFGIWAADQGASWLNEAVAYGALLTGMSLYTIVSSFKKNRRLDKSYAQEHKAI